MPLNNPIAGFNYATEFQSSALPWVTSSTATTAATQLHFDNVSRFIQLTNLAASGSGTDIKLGFTANGVNGTNYLVVQPQMTLGPLELRVKEVWIKSSSGSPAYSFIAGLTSVTQMQVLTGTLPDGNSGWQGVG